MHLLYLDESGSTSNQNEKHFILAGVAVFERTLHYLIKGIDETMDNANLSDYELHGSPILGAREEPWKSMHRPDRIELISKVLKIVEKNKRGCVAFGIVLEKDNLKDTEDPMEWAFEQIATRFDMFLKRQNQETPDNKQRGIIIMDKSSDEKKLQGLVKRFRTGGTRWGRLNNISEVPMFVDSKAARIIQLADLVAFALWRRYEFKDTTFFDIIAPNFDSEGRKIHGLLHKTTQRKACICPACLSHR